MDCVEMIRASLDDSDVSGLCDQLSSVDMSIGCERGNAHNSSSDTTQQLTNGHSVFNAFECDTYAVETELDPVTIYTQDKDGDTLLHMAIILQNNERTMTFIGKAPTSSWLSFRNRLYQTPLHLAVLTKENLVVRKLLIGGANILSRDKDGNTPLHIACRDGLSVIVRTILETVSEVNNIIPKTQNTPYDFSVYNYEGLTCLHLAAINTHTNIVELLIEKGVDVNMQEGKAGRTILHIASLTGDLNLVRTLLKLKRCNINARAYDGLTPFDLARARSQENVCMVLAAAGARYGDDDLDSD